MHGERPDPAALVPGEPVMGDRSMGREAASGEKSEFSFKYSRAEKLAVQTPGDAGCVLANGHDAVRQRLHVPNARLVAVEDGCAAQLGRPGSRGCCGGCVVLPEPEGAVV